MSEFHPNRTPLVRTRPKLTTRRILECWPFVVWVVIAVLAWRIYSGGVVFARMNGAVDVYQENITPISEGRLLKINVIRGQRVAPLSVVAEMDPAPYLLQVESLKREIVAKRIDDVNDYVQVIYKLEADLRDIQNANAEDGATIKELKSLMEVSGQPRSTTNPELQRLLNASTDTLRARVDLAKAEARAALTAQHLSQVTEAITQTKAARARLETEAALIAKSGVTFEEITKASALRADEEKQYSELKTLIDQCQLITPHGGVVDRVDKEVGEFVEAGEGVLKMVGDPEHIIAFLPQDQANDLTLGQTVWVASTSNKEDIFPSAVEAISPRINNLADATSPLPNQRVHGRDLIIKYPTEALPEAPGKPFKLLPGQTVIIHTTKPGRLPLLERIFPSDDSGKVR